MKIKLFAQLVLLVWCVFSLHQVARAQEDNSLSLSVTPTLFDMNAVADQTWQSGIKIINNNKSAITVYADIVNFAPQGESGEGKFIPVFEKATEGTTLAEWITISHEPITIEAEKSFSIPFTVHVPSGASPGGHFAAILIGTKPPKSEKSFKVSTSQIVTSLFFVRIAGDVEEEGTVREFTVSHTFVSSPEADFQVRFENKGNVHLQPQGEIVITNMWGKERGVIPINRETHFGNVLPKSIRKFDFSWKGEPSFSDIGRYKAALTLSYGSDEKKFVTSNNYFYVIPVKAGLITLSFLFTFVLLVRWSIKVYVRRMLLLAGVETDSSHLSYAQRRTFIQEGDVRIVKKISVKTPVQRGMVDLKERLNSAQAFLGKAKAIYSFAVAYKLFFIAATALLCAVAVLVFFVHSATTEQRDYQVVINNKDAEVTLSSEEILYEKTKNEGLQNESSQPLVSRPKEQHFDLILVNSSDTPGQAAKLQKQLEASGYIVLKLQSDFEKSKEKSVIVYDTLLQEQALKLSTQIGHALLSARPDSLNSSSTITIYIGNDYLSE